MKADFKGYKNCRGIIGAAAAIAWSPLKDNTYELISYRQSARWGTTRKVDYKSVIKMDSQCKTTFDNFDYENHHNRITPNSPCPILYGIRGDNVNELFEALNIVESEPIESWLIFETNQGTDDHLEQKNIEDIRPYESVIVNGSVSKNPYTIEGGHVIFSIKNNSSTIDCAAYEPTKKFRNIIRNLVIDDIVEIYGSARNNPMTVNIEKIKVNNLTKIFQKIENPICPKCKKHMKSIGSNQGYKCKRCGAKSNKPKLKEKKRTINLGFYEVPVCARRHLSKPLKRMCH
jgi:tRNA(Ile2)-agmatinylcytidine synthase